MGRRPNAIVSEYFVRGEKLGDASNRYAHTCKRCGQFFPKGRIDNLTGHLLRQCPSLTQDDRQHVFQTTQQQAVVARRMVSDVVQPSSSPLGLIGYTVSGVSLFNCKSQAEVKTQIEHQESDRSNISSPHTSHREQSALDTLAEVSRRHLDYSIANDRGIDELGRNAQHRGRQIAEQALLMQLQHSTGLTPNIPPMTTEPSACSSVHSLQSSKPDVAMQDDTTTTLLEAAATSSLPKQITTHPMEEQTIVDIDPRLDDVAPAVKEPQAAPSSDQVSKDPTTPRSPTALTRTHAHIDIVEPLVSSKPVSGFGLLERSNKHRARGRFDDIRRKEVQGIRKRGACIRCRMLKKPCSEDTPCNTCESFSLNPRSHYGRGVESARLWKSSCIRTRLAEVFTLWSIGFYHSKAKVEVPSAVRGLQHNAIIGRIEVRCFATTDLCMTFAARKYTSHLMPNHSAMDDIHPGPGQGNAAPSFDQQSKGKADTWLLDEEEALPHKIEKYANNIVDACIAEETSTFLKATLLRAHESILSKDADQASVTTHRTRSCYNLQDHLLRNVVELWIETCILAGMSSATFQVHYVETNAPCTVTDLTSNTNEESGRQTVTRKPVSERSTELIYAQLLAATEVRCSGLCKVVTNELERRLLQRQQVSRFDTFLSATILLNCIERMTGVFRELEIRDGTAEEGAKANNVRMRQLTSRPLKEPLHQLWAQGEQFSDLLIMLLRMRALPPPTKSLPDGRLVVDHPQASNAKPAAKRETQEQMKATAAWLNPLDLQTEKLTQIRDSGMPGYGSGVRAWDLKFISQILLPEEKQQISRHQQA